MEYERPDDGIEDTLSADTAEESPAIEKHTAARSGALTFLGGGLRTKLFTAVAVLGSMTGSEREAQSAARNVPNVQQPGDVHKLPTPHLKESEKENILKQAASSNDKLRNAIEKASREKATAADHSRAASLFYREASSVTPDDDHAGNLWTLLERAHHEARTANNLDTMYRVIDKLRLFDKFNDREIVLLKIKSFKSVFAKVPKEEQRNLAKTEVLQLLKDAQAINAFNEIPEIARLGLSVLKKGKQDKEDMYAVMNIRMLNGRAQELAKEYDTLSGKLRVDADNPAANEEMAEFYMKKTGNWASALGHLTKSKDAEVADIAQEIIDNAAWFADDAELAEQDVSDLVQLGERCFDAAKKNGHLRAYLNIMATTCLHRAREFANKVQKAKIDPLIDNNFLQADFLARAASPRMLEITTENVDLLNELEQKKVKWEFGNHKWYPNVKHLLKLVVGNSAEFTQPASAAYLVFPVKISEDFLIETAYLPKAKSNLRINIPLKKGHQVTLDFNNTETGEELSGLSRIDGKELPPGFRVKDNIAPNLPVYMQARGLHQGENRMKIIDDRIQFDPLTKQYTTFHFEFTFNMEDATIHPDYVTPQGDEEEGVGVAVKVAGIEMYVLNIGQFPKEPETRDVQEKLAVKH